MPKLPPLDTLSKIVGILAGLITVSAVIASSFGISPPHLLLTSNSTTAPAPAYAVNMSGNITTFTSAAGFRIQFPTAVNYQAADNYSNRPLITLSFNYGEPCLLSAYIIDDFKGQHLSLQDVVAINKIHSIYPHKDYHVISEGNTTLGGEPAYKIVHSSNASNLTPGENNNAINVWVFAMHNGRMYNMAYSALPSCYNTSLPRAQHIIDSFSYT